MSKSNILKCRHCHWQTAKWGAHTDMNKAWALLRQHIRSEHPEFDDKLDQFAEDSRDFEAEYIRSLHLTDEASSRRA